MKGSELKDLISSKNLTKQQAADIIGVARQTVYEWLADGVPAAKSDFVRKALSKTVFVDNPEEKNIYSKINNQLEENNKLHSPIQDANSKYLKPFPFSGFELEISVLEPSAHVGYVDAIETNVEPKLPTTQIRTSYASDQGNYMIYIMHDRRLEDGTDNTIFQGTEILVKEIPKEKWKDKLRFKFHHILVVRPEGIALYDVIDHNAETGEITCTSYNPEFPTEVIKLDSVLKLFYALRKLSEPIKKKK